MQAGAADFIEKPYSEETLMAALRSALQWAREEEVCKMICKGHSNNEISRLLEISSRTVEVHRARVMEKTGAANLSVLMRKRVMMEIQD
jgi:two-component system response regulator FixJ